MDVGLETDKCDSANSITAVFQEVLVDDVRASILRQRRRVGRGMGKCWFRRFSSSVLRRTIPAGKVAGVGGGGAGSQRREDLSMLLVLSFPSLA
jgi:hypothetical protein